jgi:hypothetical protein
MGHVAKYGSGTFCWVDIATDDPEAAASFYKRLFGWTPGGRPSNGGTFRMLKQDGRDVAALYQLSDEDRAGGGRPHWLSYVSVDDVAESARRAQSLGGRIVQAPVDVGVSGKMSLIEDPEGIRFGLWEAKEHIGSQIVNEPCTLCWNELVTSDPDAAGGFYTDLFGWTAETMEMPGGDYTMFSARGHAMGGMMEQPDGAPAHWMVYFSVEDVDDTLRTMDEHGGTLYFGPHDIEVGRLAVVSDPQGAVFSIIAMRQADEPEFPAKDAPAAA